MLDYHAPLTEMKFVIKNLIGLESLVSLYGNDEFTEETLEVIRQTVDKARQPWMVESNLKHIVHAWSTIFNWFSFAAVRRHG